MLKRFESVTCKFGYRAFAAIAVLGLASAPGNAAALLSGSFAGTAFNSQVFNPPYGNFDGSAITGTFSVDLTGCSTSSGPGPSTGGCLVAVPAFLNPAVPGSSITYGVPDTFVQVFNTASTQRLRITFGYQNPYVQADFELAGGTNAFINGTDYGSLHAGAIDLARSTLELRGGRSYRTELALNSITFNQAAPGGVPDAPAWAMLLTGFAMTGTAVRGRNRKQAAA